MAMHRGGFCMSPERVSTTLWRSRRRSGFQPIRERFRPHWIGYGCLGTRGAVYSSSNLARKRDSDQACTCQFARVAALPKVCIRRWRSSPAQTISSGRSQRPHYVIPRTLRLKSQRLKHLLSEAANTIIRSDPRSDPSVPCTRRHETAAPQRSTQAGFGMANQNEIDCRRLLDHQRAGYRSSQQR